MSYMTLLIIWIIGCVLFGVCMKKYGSKWSAGITAITLGMLFGCGYLLLEKRGANDRQLMLAGAIGVIVVVAVFTLLHSALAPQMRRQPAAKPDTKPEVQPEAKPEIKPEIRPVIKPEVEPEIQVEAKPERKPKEKTTEETGDKFLKIIKRAEKMEQGGQAKLALRLYEDCMMNATTEQVRSQAKDGYERCKQN